MVTDGAVGSGASVRDILQGRRNKPCVYVRWRVWQELFGQGYSLQGIAAAANVDRTTVLYGLSRVEMIPPIELRLPAIKPATRPLMLTARRPRTPRAKHPPSDSERLLILKLARMGTAQQIIAKAAKRTPSTVRKVILEAAEGLPVMVPAKSVHSQRASSRF